jgi:hypothetical protein
VRRRIKLLTVLEMSCVGSMSLRDRGGGEDREGKEEAGEVVCLFLRGQSQR